MILKETDREYDLGRGGRWISPSDIKGLRVPQDFIVNRSKPRKPKDFFDVGTAFHTAVLEPKEFGKKVTYFPEEDFPNKDKVNVDGSYPITTKANKDALNEFREKEAERVVLREKDWNIITSMVLSFESHWGAKAMLNLKKGMAEHSFYARYIWDKNGLFDRIEPAEKDDQKDSDLIMLVRTKADYAHNERAFAMDLKSALSVNPHEFAAAAARLEYDIQAAMVLDLVSANKDERYESFIFVAMEKVTPYYLAMYDVLYQDIIDAQRIYVKRLNVIRQAMRDEKWPGFEYLAENEWGLLTLELPGWYKYNQANSKF